jgi:hypothetical protein
MHTYVRTYVHKHTYMFVIAALAAPVHVGLYKYQVRSYVFMALTYFVPLRFKYFSVHFL